MSILPSSVLLSIQLQTSRAPIPRLEFDPHRSNHSKRETLGFEEMTVLTMYLISSFLFQRQMMAKRSFSQQQQHVSHLMSIIIISRLLYYIISRIELIPIGQNSALQNGLQEMLVAAHG